jgi:hypothetical protein
MIFILGTHDVQNVTIANSSNLSLSVDYLDGSRARGILCLLIYITPEQTVDFTKSVSVVVKRNSFNGLVFELPNSKYIALGYDVESDGLVQPEVSLYPAYTENLTVTDNQIGMLFFSHNKLA